MIHAGWGRGVVYKEGEVIEVWVGEGQEEGNGVIKVSFRHKGQKRLLSFIVFVFVVCYWCLCLSLSLPFAFVFLFVFGLFVFCGLGFWLYSWSCSCLSVLLLFGFCSFGVMVIFSTALSPSSCVIFALLLSRLVSSRLVLFYKAMGRPATRVCYLCGREYGSTSIGNVSCLLSCVLLCCLVLCVLYCLILCCAVLLYVVLCFVVVVF